MSPKLPPFVLGWEACRLDRYRDGAGLWTIGVGHLCEPGDTRERITQAEADELFVRDLAEREVAVRKLLRRSTTWVWEVDALTSFAFNLGVQALSNSTLLRYYNGGMVPEAAAQFLRWDKMKVDGKLVVSNGLHKRRVAEAAMFVTGCYDGRP